MPLPNVACYAFRMEAPLHPARLAIALLLAPATLPAQLRFTPAEPLSGARITVTYTPSNELKHNKRLFLRSRFRSAADLPGAVPPVRVSATLDAQRDGTFRGALQLPDSAVYASFAVEDSGGSHVDSNAHRLWDLLVYGRDGRPLYAALEQRHDELMPRDWTGAFAVAREASELYPERARAWYIRSFFESAVLTGRALDSVRAEQRARLAVLDSVLSHAETIDPDDIGAMWMYASTLHDSARAARWGARLLADAPRTMWAVQYRFNEMSRGRRSQREVLAALDSMWSAVGPAMSVFAGVGAITAESLGDSVAITEWVERALATKSMDSLHANSLLARFPATRQEGLRRMRALVRSFARGDDSYRNLDRDAAREQVARLRVLRLALDQLATALRSVGDSAAARDTLILATSAGWDAPLSLSVAQLVYVEGDTGRAIRLLARAVVDPTTATPAARLAESWNRGRTRDPRWSALLAGARREMRRSVLASAIDRPLPTRVRLTRGDGQVVSLTSIAKGRPTVVAFWSRYCDPSVRQLPQLAHLASALDSLGASLVTIPRERPDDELRDFLAERHLDFPVYEDSWHEARAAFRQFATPQLYVVDREGRIRFELASIDAVVTEVAALNADIRQKSGQSASR